MSTIHPEIVKLCVFDTIHDFWSGTRGHVSKEVHLNTQKEIIKHIKQFNQLNFAKCQDETLDKCIMNISMRSMTETAVPSVSSGFETASVQYYENISSLHGIIKTNVYTVTYGEIIDAWVNNKNKADIPPEWETYIQNMGVDDGLELDVGTHPVYGSFGMVQHNKMEHVIARFIKYYMFPEQMRTNPNAVIHFTFDAGSGIVGKIFFNIPTAFNLVTPANIADSALTSLQKLNGRSIYHFPINTPTDNVYLFDSNIFSQQHKINMMFQNNTTNKDTMFSNTNPYGFVYQIQPKRGAPIQFPFSSSVTTGAPIGYISEFLYNPDPQVTKPHISNVMRLDGLKGNTGVLGSGALFDIKRAGDFEQVNSAKASQTTHPNVVFSTIDVLCGLYARCIQQPVMIRYGEKLTMYRFPVSSDTPKYAEWYTLKYEMIKALQYVNILKTIISSSLVSSIAEFKTQCIHFIRDGLFLDHTKHKLEQVKSGETQSPIEKIVEMVAKCRLLDIVAQIDKIQDIRMDASLDPLLNNYIQTLEKYLPLFEDLPANEGKLTLAETEIKTLLSHVFPQSDMKRGGEQLLPPPPSTTQNPPMVPIHNDIVFPENAKNLLRNIQSTFSLSVNKKKLLGLGENPLDLRADVIFTRSSTGIPILKPVGKIASVNWANKQWGELYAILVRFGHIVNSKSERVRYKMLGMKLEQMEYEDCVTKIINAFSNKTWGDAILRVLLPNVNTDHDYIDWYNHLENSLREIYGAVLSNYPLPVAGGRTKRCLVGGGNFGHLDDKRLCVLDLYKLFLQITSTASAFVESTISQSALITGGAKCKRKRARYTRRAFMSDGGGDDKKRKLENYDFPQTRKKKPDVSDYIKLAEVISMLSQPQRIEAVRACMENIAYVWETGLYEVQMDLDNVYVYEPMRTEYVLLKLMSYYSVFKDGKFLRNTDKDGGSGHNVVMEHNAELFRGLTWRDRKHYERQMNDIAQLYLSQNSETQKSIPAEVITLVLLCIFDNILQVDKDGWMKKIIGFQTHQVHFASITEWERLENWIYMIVGYMTAPRDVRFPKELIIA